MHLRQTVIVVLTGLCMTAHAYGLNLFRTLSIEVDPVAPASSFVETKGNVRAEKWGGSAEFNLGGSISTGPELWFGNFTTRGPDDPNAGPRREDMQPGEQHKLDAVRMRWGVSLWEVPMTMRGWYVKAGYNYTRVNSRANRFHGWEVSLKEQDPMESTDLVTDVRHGAMVGFGERWLFADYHCSVTIGLSYSANFRRDVSVQGKDPDARSDYNAMIEDMPESRMSTRAMPETNAGVGYLF